MDKMKHWIEKSKIFIGYIVIILFCILWKGYLQSYFGDAQDYWASADGFMLDGEFKIWNYNSCIRGFLWPLILFVIKIFSSIIGVESSFIFWVSSSVFYSTCLYYLIPNTYLSVLGKTTDINKNKMIIIRMLFSISIIIMFSGLIKQPLTDLVAFCFATAGINCWVKMNNKEITSIVKKSFYALLTGLFVACAYYTRPIYLILFIMIILAFIIVLLLKRELNLLNMIMVVCGVFVVFIPQIMINYYNFHTISPLIQTERFYGEGKSLYLMQLYWGISMQKYETNSNLSIYPGYAVPFTDMMGEALLIKNNVLGFSNYKQYFVFIYRNFPDMCLIYLKHIFNGLDIVYRELYIENLYGKRLFIQFFNYTLLFGGISCIIEKVKKNYKSLNINNYLVLLFLISPTLLAIPTAVEVRFFLPVFVLIYLFSFVFLIEKVQYLRTAIINKYNQKQNLKEFLGENQLFIRGIISYFIFIIICFLLNKSTFDVLTIPL